MVFFLYLRAGGIDLLELGLLGWEPAVWESPKKLRLNIYTTGNFKSDYFTRENKKGVIVSCNFQSVTCSFMSILERLRLRDGRSSLSGPNFSSLYCTAQGGLHDERRQ